MTPVVVRFQEARLISLPAEYTWICVDYSD